MGATEVGWERGATAGGSSGSGSAFNIGNKTITHHVADRPPDQLEKRTGREYIQPQWVFDSFNTGVLLLVGPYAPGRAPPPHLSPFVDDKAQGYVPRQREILDQYAAEVQGLASATSAMGGTIETGSAASVEGANFKNFAKELKAEASGVWHSDFREEQKKDADERATKAHEPVEKVPATVGGAPVEVGTVPAKPTDEEEERLRAKAMMPKKHKRLLQRIEKSAQKKTDSNERLSKKRKQNENSRSTA